ncbi:MAG: helix-turn-helix domain-containing protein [Ardenticatenaceae bacterium]|nr:helix-turn-helix domain-containing protein [Ardenticatenaceae bacterium]
MNSKGQLSLLLAERLASGKEITRIEQLAEAAGINRYMLDQLDQGHDVYVNLDSLRRVGETLGLDSLSRILGLTPPERAKDGRIEERPIKIMTEQKGISMRQLAAQVGVRPASLYNLDIGEAKLVRVSHLVEICRILELSIDELAGYRPGVASQQGDSGTEQ